MSSPAPAPVRQLASDDDLGKPEGGWRLALYKVIFESDTRAGQVFDKCLIALILLSIAVVIVDSVERVHWRFQAELTILEWIFTALFTAEYVARLLCVQRPARYARSFYGIVDLLAVLPTYLGLLFPQAHALIDVRILRLLRVFRIFKLTAYMAEYQMLGLALAASRRKILVFLSVVMMIVVVMGTLMYVVEGPRNGFTSIPVAIYWAVSTMTTVGFGDIVPKTDIGRAIASIMMLVGWGTLAVPTGIVTSELTLRRVAPERMARICGNCHTEGHEADAGFCRACGTSLPRVEPK